MQKPHVNFFVPGYSKCGTTTFCSLLADHPEIFIPEIKEPNFFAHAWGKGWGWYAKQFEGSQNMVVGEGSTFYTAATTEEAASDRILEFYPESKFFFIARNPITRIESSYREHHHSGHHYGVHVPLDLEKTLREFPNIIDDTSYWSRLKPWRKKFGDDRIHILFFEDLIRDQQNELEKCFDFLGVDSSVQISGSDRKLNPGSKKCYDTDLMRWIRTHSASAKAYQWAPRKIRRSMDQNTLFRKPFDKAIEWSPSALQYTMDKVESEAKSFLEFAGKPADYWDFEPRARQSATPMARAA